MRTILAAAAMAMASPMAIAALAPIYQNDKDLTLLVDFVRSHPVVLQSLRSIDLERRQIHFSANCVARFERPRNPTMMPGPAPALRYIGSTCPIDHPG
jgi:hypothetical protein